MSLWAEGSDCCFPSTRLGTSLPSPAGRALAGRLESTGKNTPKRTLWGFYPKILISLSFIPPLSPSSLSSLRAFPHFFGFPSSLWASPYLSSLAYTYPTFSIHVIACSFKPTSLTCLLSQHLPEMPFLLSIFLSAWPPSFEHLVQASLPQRFLNTFQKSPFESTFLPGHSNKEWPIM